MTTAALLLCGSVSCGGSTEPDELGLSDVVGSWDFVREGNASCFGGATTETYSFSIQDGASVLEGGAVNVVTVWDFVRPDRFGWLLSGNFNVRTRAVTLNFWHRPLETGASFVGEIGSDGRVSGTLRDPKPGYEPHTVIGSCVFEMVGQRVTP